MTTLERTRSQVRNAGEKGRRSAPPRPRGHRAGRGRGGHRLVTCGRTCAVPGGLLLAVLLAATLASPHSRPVRDGRRPACDPDNGGLDLPPRFCALVVADDVGRARHVAVTGNGDIYIALRRAGRGGGGVVALRDTTGDGRADVRLRFAQGRGGTGLGLYGGHLYFGQDDAVLRFPLDGTTLGPAGDPTVVAAGLPSRPPHAAKSLAFGPDGSLFVNIGSPSNACEMDAGSAGSPGRDPCPELRSRAGIWRFRAGTAGQARADGERFATGLRNTVALAVNPADGRLYGVVHGRDRLHGNWPDLFTAEKSAETPSEEFVRIEEGDRFSWPYCYHDRQLGRFVLAPEYGGDGEKSGRCASLEQPLLAFPAHWAPNALLFYRGDQFPARYRGGAFVAFHGSWNRAPLPQEGYRVVFVPFAAGAPSDTYERFADGFAGARPGPRTADHRPAGLAEGPDGSLYVTDDVGGRVWRIMYRP